MAYHIVIASGFVIFVLNLVLNSRALRRLAAYAVIGEPAPLVSLLIRARDEEASIESCLQSLRHRETIPILRYRCWTMASQTTQARGGGVPLADLYWRTRKEAMQLR